MSAKDQSSPVSLLERWTGARLGITIMWIAVLMAVVNFLGAIWLAVEHKSLFAIGDNRDLIDRLARASIYFGSLVLALTSLLWEDPRPRRIARLVAVLWVPSAVAQFYVSAQPY